MILHKVGNFFNSVLRGNNGLVVVSRWTLVVTWITSKALRAATKAATTPSAKPLATPHTTTAAAAASQRLSHRKDISLVPWPWTTQTNIALPYSSTFLYITTCLFMFDNLWHFSNMTQLFAAENPLKSWTSFIFLPRIKVEEIRETLLKLIESGSFLYNC